MIVVPVLVMPLLTIGLGVLSVSLFGQAMLERPAVMVLGGEDSPQILAVLTHNDVIRVVPSQRNYADAIISRRIRAAVEIPPDFDVAVSRGDPVTVRIYLYEGELKSGFGAEKLRQFLSDYRDRMVHQHLESRQIPESLIEPFRIQQTNVAPPEMVGGALLGGLVPYFVVLFCVTGAMYPAIDLTAGEKERGTIETILCSPVSRVHLVIGKFLMVLTASLFAAALSLTSMALTFSGAKAIVAGVTQPGASALQMRISPQAVGVVFLMVIPLAVFFSATLLTIALFAKSYKEAQSYLAPLLTLVIVPAVISLLPGVELNVPLALVPVLNTSLVSKEIVSGTYHWTYIVLIFASSCAYAGIALWMAIRLFQREEVLFRT